MKVIVTAPASTSNLGPGFDCLGLALSLTSTFTVEPSERLVITGCDEAFRTSDNLVLQGFREVCAKAGREAPPVRLDIRANVPVARGLGSSSTCIAGGAAAANALLGNPFSRRELFDICAGFEGHPDNAAPCVLGGLSASFAIGSDDGAPRFHSIPLALDPAWRFAAVIPNYEVRTADARRAMPREISVRDSVFTTSHAIAMTAALASGDEALLSEACADRLHEPCRRRLIPDYEALRALALDMGMAAFFISGSGSTLIAMTKDEARAQAFTRAALERFPRFDAHVLEACATGVEARVDP